MSSQFSRRLSNAVDLSPARSTWISSPLLLCSALPATAHTFPFVGTAHLLEPDLILLCCRKFASACAEALLLCRKLVQYNVGRHLQKSRSDLITTCGRFKLSVLLSQDGVRMATGVLMDLLKRHTPSGRLPVSLSDDLLHGCPMYFPYHQQQYLSAFQQLEGINKPGVSAYVPSRPCPRSHWY